VLSKANRIVRAEDFKMVTRTGSRFVGRGAIVYVNRRAASTPDRFGFIVTKSVGSAVVRNLVRRRLRAISREFAISRERAIGRNVAESGALAADIVIRALPGSTDLSWRDLHREISETIEKGVARQ
jgi:ribonuclease P protein component